MTNNKEKITTSKSIKTLLFAGLIMTLAIPITGMSLAEAKVSEDKIPEDKLLKRDSNAWKSQYKDTAEFEHDKNSFKSYVDTVHPDSKWNKVTKKNQMKIHNFNTLSEERFAGLNVLLMDVQNQKNNNTYDPTDAEKKFHDWAAEKISNPTMPENVKSNMMEHVIEAYNDSANHGHVPTELYLSDSDFWSNISTDKICEYHKDCDPNGMELGIDNHTFGLIPNAYALSIGHLLSAKVEATSCSYTSVCWFEDSQWFVGTGTLSVNTQGSHPTVKKLTYTITDKSYYYGIDEDHTISGWMRLGDDTYNIPSKTDQNEVTKSGSYVFDVDCGSSSCGSMALSATAQDVTI